MLSPGAALRSSSRTVRRFHFVRRMPHPAVGQIQQTLFVSHARNITMPGDALKLSLRLAAGSKGLVANVKRAASALQQLGGTVAKGEPAAQS